MECPDKGRRGGAMASRGRKEGEGMVAAVLLFSAALSKQPLAVSSDTGLVFYGSNGVNGSNGAGWWKQNGKSLKKITSKGNYSEKSCIFAFENKT